MPGSETTAEEQEGSGPETEEVRLHKPKPAVNQETENSKEPIEVESDSIGYLEGKKDEAKDQSEVEKEKNDQQVEELLQPYIFPDSPPMPQWLINILAQKALQDAIDSFAKFREKDRSAGSADDEVSAAHAFQDTNAHI